MLITIYHSVFLMFRETSSSSKTLLHSERQGFPVLTNDTFKVFFPQLDTYRTASRLSFVLYTACLLAVKVRGNKGKLNINVKLS